MKRKLLGQKKKQLFTKRFFPAGNYTWVVPPGCTEVDVFIVGGGGGSNDAMPGGGGYTKTFKKDTTGWRDGDAIKVTPGESIPIIVGKGGAPGSYNNGYIAGDNGGSSQFKNASYRVNGGFGGNGSTLKCGDGGSGAAGRGGIAGSDGGSGGNNATSGGTGQGHTTRDFGEPTGKRNAGGGKSGDAGINSNKGGESDYIAGGGGTSYSSSGAGLGGGGYGGGGGGIEYTWKPGGYDSKGGDGTVLIRFWAYTE